MFVPEKFFFLAGLILISMAVLALIQCEVMLAIVLVNGRRNIRLGRQSLREALVFYPS